MFKRIILSTLLIQSFIFVKSQDFQLPADSVQFFVSYIESNNDKLLISRADTLSSGSSGEIMIAYRSEPNLKEVEKQIGYTEQLIKYKPNRIDYWYSKSYIYFTAKLYDDLFNSLDELLSYSKTNNNEWYNLNDFNRITTDEFLLGMSFYVSDIDKTKDQNGEFYYEKIAQLVQSHYPEHQQTYNILAISAFEKQDYQESAINYTKALSTDPDNIYYLVNLFNCQYFLNNKDEALKIYEKVKKLNHKEAIQYIENNLQYF